MITVAGLILGDAACIFPVVVYLSVYRKERRYGGPEEGGWWYNHYTLEGCIKFPLRETAEAYLKEAQAKAEERNRAEAPLRHMAMAGLPDIESAYYPEGYILTGWGDGGELVVFIEDSPGSNSTTYIPHYE